MHLTAGNASSNQWLCATRGPRKHFFVTNKSDEGVHAAMNTGPQYPVPTQVVMQNPVRTPQNPVPTPWNPVRTPPKTVLVKTFLNFHRSNKH